MEKVTMETLVSLCKNRGFVYPGSEIYGGLANTWDFGPLGVELKNNIKKAWWKKFVQESHLNVGLDAAILMATKTWEASGHLGNFADPLIDCKSCKSRFRADKLIEDFNREDGKEPVVCDGWSNEELENYICDNSIKCPECGKSDFTKIRQFNLMFKTFQGVTEDSKSEIYLRPETAQGIFVNFKNVQRTSRRKIPFGICQIGKSFRNEITPGNFIFRVREFEQMELEFFCEPGTELKWFDYWKEKCGEFLASLNMQRDNYRFRDHETKELSHYSNATTDIEYLFPFGFGELWGIASRTDYDLSKHAEYSKQNLNYQDSNEGQDFIPYVIEPSLGVERLTLAFLTDAYREERWKKEDGSEDSRVVMGFHPALAPFKAAVLPLNKKKLGDKAMEIRDMLAKHFMVDYDETGSIGKRYRRQDEIGTPFSICVDFDTENDNCVTIRDRDSMEQERVNIDQLVKYIEEKLLF